MKIKSVHSLQWIAEPLEGHSSFVQKKMFGCEALYLHDRQVLVLAAKAEPWNGLMICTSREHHASLMAEFSSLKPHSVLGKWLYISQKDDNFEEIVQKIVGMTLNADPRIGVESKSKMRR